ncbi:MAG: hypothetical protein ISS15_12045 [Alphaproteobacteria bacterium]|nr:hypothetical protein [Alphaproteobacteria bacterium]MBL6936566.1 hypothetical protein [Alphaproteobacteria bacterium]MBL7098383.1 hypothetical protein [Alphaproteobacteria bacterium]
MRKLVAGVAISALIGFGCVAAGTLPASAHIVCNDDGDCWHTDSDYRHHSDWRIRDHYPDDWYFHRDWDHDHDHHWHDYREGRGYWRHGVWITF